jgi:uncharacterized protein (DUF1501 family)
MITRRELLRRSTLFSFASTVPAFVERTARAADPGPDSRVLVLIQLDGGNDGINTIVPYEDEGYERARRDLRLDPRGLVKLDEKAGIGLHGAMRPLGKLFEDSRLAIVQGVGYPNPTRSHFESMAIWHSARMKPADRDGLGWLGRGLDAASPPVSGAPGAIFLSRSDIPLAIRGRRTVATSMTRADDFVLASDIDPRGGAHGPAGSLITFVGRAAADAYGLANQMAAMEKARDTSSAYPKTALAEHLSFVARLIRAGSRTRVYYALQSGYDTHSFQLGRHAELLGELAGALRAFHDDLANAKLDDRVAVLCFSEFGRRVEENGSQGTDHGTAGPVLLSGSRVCGGLIGQAPSLTDLDSEGDLNMTVDFRQVYATVLDQWLGVSAKAALGSSYTNLPLFAV